MADTSRNVNIELYYDGAEEGAPSRIEVVQFDTPEDAEAGAVHLEAYVLTHYPRLAGYFSVYRQSEGVPGGLARGKRFIDEMAQDYMGMEKAADEAEAEAAEGDEDD